MHSQLHTLDAIDNTPMVELPWIIPAQSARIVGKLDRPTQSAALGPAGADERVAGGSGGPLAAPAAPLKYTAGTTRDVASAGGRCPRLLGLIFAFSDAFSGD